MAAAEQGQLWRYHDTLFAHHDMQLGVLKNAHVHDEAPLIEL